MNLLRQCRRQDVDHRLQPAAVAGDVGVHPVEGRHVLDRVADVLVLPLQQLVHLGKRVECGADLLLVVPYQAGQRGAERGRGGEQFGDRLLPVIQLFEQPACSGDQPREPRSGWPRIR